MNTTLHDDTTRRHQSKYENPNPIHRYVLGRFFDTAAQLLSPLNIESVLDLGCGEAYFHEHLQRRGVHLPHVVGVDLREDAVQVARGKFPAYDFYCGDIRTLDLSERRFDLVIASQILEHMPDAPTTLRQLSALSNQFLLLTVPHEPWFQVMNLLRFRDISRLGNHPEHINRWSLSRFCKLVQEHMDLVHATTSFPFILVLARTRAA
ncbi:MAG: hypothetical protein RL518_1029 [Pseudomonadota bacterium]|jgi:SAM-dependent methyltransferase